MYKERQHFRLLSTALEPLPHREVYSQLHTDFNLHISRGLPSPQDDPASVPCRTPLIADFSLKKTTSLLWKPPKGWGKPGHVQKPLATLGIGGLSGIACVVAGVS